VPEISRSRPTGTRSTTLSPTAFISIRLRGSFREAAYLPDLCDALHKALDEALDTRYMTGTFTKSLTFRKGRERSAERALVCFKELLDTYHAVSWLPSFDHLLEAGCSFSQIDDETGKLITESPPSCELIPRLPKPVGVSDPEGTIVVAQVPMSLGVMLYRVLLDSLPRLTLGEEHTVFEAWVQPVPTPGQEKKRMPWWNVCPIVKIFGVNEKGHLLTDEGIETVCTAVENALTGIEQDPEGYMKAQTVMSVLSTDLTVAFDQIAYLIQQGCMEGELVKIPDPMVGGHKVVDQLNEEQIMGYWISQSRAKPEA